MPHCMAKSLQEPVEVPSCIYRDRFYFAQIKLEDCRLKIGVLIRVKA
jgi:hypothetical protein